MNGFNLLPLKFVDWIGGLSICKIFNQLKKEQYLPKEQLEKMRAERVTALFSLARKSVPYYNEYTSYAAVPVLTKNMIRHHAADFFSAAYKGKVIKKSTSGSTGTPLVFYYSAQAQSYLWAALLLSWEVTGYRFGDKVAFIAGSALIKQGIKHTLFYRLMNIILLPAAILTEKVEQKYIDSLTHNKVKLIYGYATAINTLADYIIMHKMSAPQGLLAVVSTAELLTDKMRANIEKAFGVKVYNQYGCGEAGVSAFECEHHHLHLISSRCDYEINKNGVLISTDLANEAYIMMKYNTGDIVKFADEPCSCGRTYPVIESLEGREDDVVIDKNHKAVHSAYFVFLLKADKSIRQYQVFFDERNICLTLTVDGSFFENHYQHYLDSIKENLDFDSYEIKINQQFVRKKNLKHSFIVDNREKKLAAV